MNCTMKLRGESGGSVLSRCEWACRHVGPTWPNVPNMHVFKIQAKKRVQAVLKTVFLKLFVFSSNSRSCSKRRPVRSFPSPAAWGRWRKSKTACGRIWRKRKRVRGTWKSRSPPYRLRLVHSVTFSLSTEPKPLSFVSPCTENKLMKLQSHSPLFLGYRWRRRISVFSFLLCVPLDVYSLTVTVWCENGVGTERPHLPVDLFTSSQFTHR